MKFIIAIRHGSYSEQALDQKGREQIAQRAEAFAEILKEIPPERIRIRTSTIERARESGGIIAVRLEVKDVEAVPSAFEEVNLPSAQVIETSRHDARLEALIIVGHKPFIERFPGYFTLRDIPLNVGDRDVFGRAVSYADGFVANVSNAPVVVVERF